MNNEMSTKRMTAKNLECICYVENMLDDWQVKISDIVQVPFAYCVHDLDTDSKSEHRKKHVHLILAFTNTTTYSHAIEVANRLSAPGRICCSTVQGCVSIRRCYDYLIHDTEACRKEGKYLYPAECRITGNNFDIGQLEQLSQQDIFIMFKELAEFILDNCIWNFSSFVMEAQVHFDKTGRWDSYFDVIKRHSAFFERLTKGNYQLQFLNPTLTVPLYPEESVSERVAEQHASNTKTPRNTPVSCCPVCGSVNIKKSGKTLAGSQRWQCVDCLKTFILR